MRYLWIIIIVVWVISLFQIIPEVLPETQKLDELSIGLIFMYSFISLGTIYVLMSGCMMLYNKIERRRNKNS